MKLTALPVRLDIFVMINLPFIAVQPRGRLGLIQVPGFPSAIRVFPLTHSRRIVLRRYS